MKTAKLGERMSFDPTSIPPQQGKLMFVGDILLKDNASNTHRGHYLRYLCKEVLPEDTPAFDIKSDTKILSERTLSRSLPFDAEKQPLQKWRRS